MLKYKERCRKDIIKAIYECNPDVSEDFATREIKFYEDIYSDLKVKDYIVKIGNIKLSYFYRDDLTSRERIVFAEGMEFADVAIGDITANNLLIIPEEIQLEYIKNKLLKKQKNGEISLNKNDIEIFKCGILTACTVNFNIVDTENIFSKNK